MPRDDNPHVTTKTYDGGADTPALEDATAFPRLSLQSRVFELRAAGSEVVEQAIDIDVPAGAGFFVALDDVHVSFARGDETTPVQGVVSGLSVTAGRRGRQLVCTARLADFPPGDLLVVRATVTVISLLGPETGA